MDRTRLLVALATLASLAAAGWAWLVDRPDVIGVSARVGAILAAVWLAWPRLVRLNIRTGLLIALGGLVVLLRPRAALIVVPTVAVVLAWPRRSSG